MQSFNYSASQDWFGLTAGISTISPDQCLYMYQPTHRTEFTLYYLDVYVLLFSNKIAATLKQIVDGGQAFGWID